MKKKPSSAQKIGRFLAYLQDAADRLMVFGFSKLKSFGDKKPKEDAHAVSKGAHKTASFLGEMFTEFYDEYVAIKRKREARKKR